MSDYGLGYDSAVTAPRDADYSFISTCLPRKSISVLSTNTGTANR